MIATPVMWSAPSLRARMTPMGMVATTGFAMTPEAPRMLMMTMTAGRIRKERVPSLPTSQLMKASTELLAMST